MNAIPSILFTLTLSVFYATCWTAPLLENAQDVLAPVMTPECTSNGGCWGWLPVQEVEENVAIVPDDMPIPRLHARRQAENFEQNAVLGAWNENNPTLQKKIPSPLSATRQMGNRVTKKDVLLSRSWGAGGMPFSVLYMSPHGPRGNHASNAQPQEAAKAAESSTPPLGHNYRIALRNGASGQQRRQYSIIPQLFISYGWGPFGK